MKAFWTALLTAIVILPPLAKAAPAAVHGMVLFGEKTAYVSHLPMFHAPHDYQVILEVSLSETPDASTLAAYQKAKAEGAALFTLEPAKMDLSQLMSGAITSFTAQLYKGHFEKNGALLGPVTVTAVKSIVSAKLDPAAPEKNEYLVFGKNGEYFAAHLINGKPGYDAIVSVGKPFKLEQNHCRAPKCGSLPQPVLDQQLPITIASQGSQELKNGDQLGLFFLSANVLDSLYYEQDELAH